MEEDHQEEGDAAGDQPDLGQGDRPQVKRPVRVGDRDDPRVGGPQEDGRALRGHHDPKQDQEAEELRGARHAPDQHPVHDRAGEEEHRKRGNHGDEGIPPEDAQCPEGEEGPQHDEGPVGHVHDPQDAQGEAESHRHDRVEEPEQDPVRHRLQEEDHHGAPPGPAGTRSHPRTRDATSKSAGVPESWFRPDSRV